MRGFRDFIIKVDYAFSQTFTTESGLELHADSRFSQDRLSNRFATIVQTPISLEGCEIKEGYQVMIDPSIFYENTYVVNGTEQTPFTIDKNKGIYKISPSMIVCYRENENEQWKGYDESLLVAPKVVEQEEVKSSLIIIELPKPKKVSDIYANVVYANKKMEELGVVNGDKILKTKGIGVSFWIDKKEYHWINNRHVLAKID